MVVWADRHGVAVPVTVELLFGQGDRFAVRPIEIPGDSNEPSLTEQTVVVIEGAERLFPRRPLLIAKESGAD